MSKTLLSLLLCLILGTISAQSDNSTEPRPFAQISLLTCDPGDQLYSTFGHSALRVKDFRSGRDLVYNYGTFSFKEPGFYVKFVRGKLLYKLGKTTFERFLAEYHYHKRGVVEQVFDLDSLQTVQMINFLENNFKPENRSYKYDFFFDNCSTRIRDIYENDIVAQFKPDAGEMTYRNQLDEYLGPMPWSDFGIDLVIGARADQISDYRNQMFLPDYLASNLDKATINGSPLVTSTQAVFTFPDRKAERAKTPFLTPIKLFLGFTLLLLIFGYLTKGRPNLMMNIFSRLWFFTLGILSLVMLFLWLGTDHIATKANWNLIWCSPLFLILAFKLGSIVEKVWLQKLTIFLLLSSILYVLLGFTFAPQDFGLHLFAFVSVQIVLLLWQLSLFSKKIA